MGDQGQRPRHPCASSSDGKGEQLRSSQQRDSRTEARTSRERLAARRSWNGRLLRIILWTGADICSTFASSPFPRRRRADVRDHCAKTFLTARSRHARWCRGRGHVARHGAGRLDVRDKVLWLLSRAEGRRVAHKSGPQIVSRPSLIAICKLPGQPTRVRRCLKLIVPAASAKTRHEKQPPETA
jgi:hypothetical protein